MTTPPDLRVEAEARVREWHSHGARPLSVRRRSAEGSAAPAGDTSDSGGVADSRVNAGSTPVPRRHDRVVAPAVVDDDDGYAGDGCEEFEELR